MGLALQVVPADSQRIPVRPAEQLRAPLRPPACPAGRVIQAWQQGLEVPEHLAPATLEPKPQKAANTMCSLFTISPLLIPSQHTMKQA